MDLKYLLDLTENQARVLEIFVEKGVLTTGEITKYTGISRPNCYDLLNKLIEKGLITRFKENNQVRYMVNKVDYEEILKDKQRELNELKKSVEEYNKKIKVAKKNDQYVIEMFSGKKGLFKFINQTLTTTKITTFGAEGILEKEYPNIWNVWVRKLKEKNISFFVIYNEKSRLLRKKKHIPLIKEKYIERDFLTNVTTQVMDEHVNIFHWQETPLVIVIKNRDLAKAYREEFNLMWKVAKK